MQKTAPLVYSFTIAQAFTVVKAFHLLFFRKNTKFPDYFRPFPNHVLRSYPTTLNLSGLFYKNRGIRRQKENFFLKALHLPFPFFHFMNTKSSVRNKFVDIVLCIFPLFCVIITHFLFIILSTLLFLPKSKFSVFPLPFLPFAVYNKN